MEEHIESLEQQLKEERLAVREVSEMLVESSRAHKKRIIELEAENTTLRFSLAQEERKTYITPGADIVLNHENAAGGQNRFCEVCRKEWTADCSYHYTIDATD